MSNCQPNSDGHPTLLKLELAREGTLNDRESAEVFAHLSNCEACQSTIQHYENTFRVLRRHRGGGRSWSTFERRLDAAEEVGHTAGSLRECVNRVPRVVWCTGAVGLALVILVFHDFGQIQRASASELLIRAVRQEAAGPARTSRRIQIKSRGRRKTLVREISDMTSPASEIKDQTAEEFRTLFERHHLDWSMPLSARSFQRWRSTLAVKVDSVGSTEFTWSITTKTTEDDLQSATLVISKADYHAIEQHLEFSNDQIEIAELPESVPPQKIAASVVVPRVEKNAPSDPALPKPEVLEPRIDLDHSEVQIRVVLRQLNADVAEQLSVQRTAEGIAVAGVVENSDRLREITDRLQSIPGAHPTVIAADSADINLHEPIGTPISSTRILRPPLLKSWLEQTFPEDDRREEFVRRALTLAREVSQHASALWHLSERYPEADWQHLSVEDASAVVAVVRDLRRSEHSLEAQLAEEVRDIAPIVYEGTAEASFASWRCEAMSHVDGARHVNQSLLLLLTRTDNDGTEAPAALRELREGLETSARIGCSSPTGRHQ